MILSLYTGLCLTLVLLYLTLIIYLIRSWNLQDSYTAGCKPTEDSHTTFSVLIAARNEEASIAGCIRSLLNNEAAEEWLSGIYIVDDFSKDNTASIVRSFSARFVHLLQMSDSGLSEPESSKKHALNYGLEHIGSEWVIQLDADVLVPQAYLHTVCCFIETHRPDFVAAPVSIIPDRRPGLLSLFQELDTMAMMAVTQAGILNRSWFLANGANMIYRRDRVRFDNHRFASGDDMDAIDRVRQQGGKLYFLKAESAVVDTKAELSWTALINQRIRWAGKNRASKSFWMIVIMVLVTLCPSVLLASAALALILDNPYLWILVFLQLYVYFTIDAILLRRLSAFFKKKYSTTGFLMARLTHLVYIPSIAVWALIRRKYLWKGRLQA